MIENLTWRLLSSRVTCSNLHQSVQKKIFCFLSIVMADQRQTTAVFVSSFKFWPLFVVNAYISDFQEWIKEVCVRSLLESLCAKASWAVCHCGGELWVGMGDGCWDKSDRPPPHRKEMAVFCSNQDSVGGSLAGFGSLVSRPTNCIRWRWGRQMSETTNIKPKSDYLQVREDSIKHWFRSQFGRGCLRQTDRHQSHQKDRHAFCCFFHPHGGIKPITHFYGVLSQRDV